MKFRLMGPRGIMDFVEYSDTFRVVCAVPECSWYLDYRGLPKPEVEALAVYHRCVTRWLGFTRYTIRPERPTGRRTA